MRADLARHAQDLHAGLSGAIRQAQLKRIGSSRTCSGTVWSRSRPCADRQTGRGSRRRGNGPSPPPGSAPSSCTGSRCRCRRTPPAAAPLPLPRHARERPPGLPPLELHWSPVDRANLFRVDAARLLAATREIRGAEGASSVLDPPMTLVYLALHAARHGIFNGAALGLAGFVPPTSHAALSRLVSGLAARPAAQRLMEMDDTVLLRPMRLLTIGYLAFPGAQRLARYLRVRRRWLFPAYGIWHPLQRAARLLAGRDPRA